LKALACQFAANAVADAYHPYEIDRLYVAAS
jgi:hypothetical protein